MAVAVVFGGGGAPAPLHEAVVQITSLAIIGCSVIRGRNSYAFSDRGLWLVVGVIVAVPILQLVPLPPSLWKSLPGRELQAASLSLIGEADSWRPLSLYPLRTLSSLLALLPGLTMLYLVAATPLPGRRIVLAGIAAAAIASATLGLAQLAIGSGLYLYEQGHGGFATGFFASRNAQADLLLIGIAAAFGYFYIERGARRPYSTFAFLSCLIFLCVAIVAAGSRAGMALLIPTLGAIAAAHLLGKWRVWKVASVLLGLGAAAVLLYNNALVQSRLARFSEIQDARPLIWEDTAYAAGQYFPFGSGVGTFVPVFHAVERLELVGRVYWNRAHNDYLETFLEGGVLTGFAVLLFAIFLAMRLISAVRNAQPHRTGYALCAGISWGVVALHSVVDYPLRNQAIMVVMAAIIGLLAKSKTPRRGEAQNPGG